MIQIGDQALFDNIREYCDNFNIPLENLLNILEDQKVLPMIRGKAAEYVAAEMIRRVLAPSREWHSHKLNLNAQQGHGDEDITIIHSRSGEKLRVESKSAVRGSFRSGAGGTRLKVPHFKVKCHRSRSHIKKAKTTNDRYLDTDFDLIVCNTSNALFKSGTLTKELELLDGAEDIEVLAAFYSVSKGDIGEIIRHGYDDWRFCATRWISDENGVIPRTPVVLLTGDKHWLPLSELEPHLLGLLESKP